MLQGRTDSLGLAGSFFSRRSGSARVEGGRPQKPLKNWRKASFFDEERRAERRASDRSDYRSSLARVLRENMALAGGCRSPASVPQLQGCPELTGTRGWSIPGGCRGRYGPEKGSLDYAGGSARGRATVLG